MPADVYGSADDKRIFVGLTGSDSVEVFDVSGREPVSIKKIKTGNGAHAFRAAGDGRHLYVSNRVANSISKIDMTTQQVVESYPVPGGLASALWWIPRRRRSCGRSLWASRPMAYGRCNTRPADWRWCASVGASQGSVSASLFCYIFCSF